MPTKYDYKALMDAVRTSLVASGFKYYEGQLWPVIELGSIPKMSLGKGFALKIDGGQSRFNDVEHNRVAFIVEFVGNPQNDAYIEDIDEMAEAINVLKSIDFDGRTTREIDERDLSILYLGRINLISFNTVIFEIKRS